MIQDIDMETIAYKKSRKIVDLLIKGLEKTFFKILHKKDLPFAFTIILFSGPSETVNTLSTGAKEYFTGSTNVDILSFPFDPADDAIRELAVKLAGPYSDIIDITKPNMN